MHAVWIHGNAAKAQWVGDPPIAQVTSQRSDGSMGGVPWTDIVGLPTGPGQTFRCRDSGGGIGFSRVVPPRLSAYFHFALPTPVILSDVRLSVARVFALWRAPPQVALLSVNAFDGPNPLSIATPLGTGRQGDGTGGLADLVDGVTRFDLTAPHSVMWGIGLSLGFGFEADLDLTFTAAGADFV